MIETEQFKSLTRDLSQWSWRRPLATDALTALVLFWPVWGWTSHWAVGYSYELAFAPVAGCYVLPLVWRRVRPQLACVLFGPALLFSFVSTDAWGVAAPGTAILVYSVARYGPRSRRWLYLALGTVVALPPVLVLAWTSMFAGVEEQLDGYWARSWEVVLTFWVLVGAVVGASWWAGRSVRSRTPSPVVPELVEEEYTFAEHLWQGWRLLQRHPILADVLLAVLFMMPTYAWVRSVAFTLMSLTPVPGGYWAPEVLAVLVTAGYCLPLVLRQTRPDLACALVIPVHLLQLLVPFIFYYGLPVGNFVVPILLFTAARHSRHATLWLAGGLAGAVLVTLSLGAYWGNYTYYSPMYVLIRMAIVAVVCGLAVAVSWGLGRLALYRSRTAGLARDRTEALGREQEQIRRLAAEQERSRIAREMHDIIAHSLSVIVVQADGASYTVSQPGDPARQLVVAGSALDVIGTTARTALAETRRLVGVLRSEQAETELAPMVSLAALPNLIEQVRATGLPIEVCFEGDPASHPPLGSGAEAAAYRIVQESLTNVLKHAGPDAFANVDVEHTPEGLRIRVRDNGQGPLPHDGAGHGLIGMRERVAAFGGQLIARPRAGRGFEVIATLPAVG